MIACEVSAINCRSISMLEYPKRQPSLHVTVGDSRSFFAFTDLDINSKADSGPHFPLSIGRSQDDNTSFSVLPPSVRTDNFVSR